MGWTRRDFAETFQRMLRQRYVEIGKEVTRLREALGYSQEALAAAAGVSTKTISRIESPPADGPHETRGSTYRKLAPVLGVTVEHLRAPLLRNAEIHEPATEESAAEILEQGLAEAAQAVRQAEATSSRSKAAPRRRKPAAGGDAA